MTAPVGDVTTPIARGKERERFLAGGLEQTLSGEFLLELFERQLKRAQAGGLQIFHVELILAPRLVYAQVAARDHRNAVLRFKFQITRLVAKAHGPKLSARILKREIKMAGAGSAKIRDFPGYPYVRVLLLQQVLDFRAQLGDAEDLLRGAEIEEGLTHKSVVSCPLSVVRCPSLTTDYGQLTFYLFVKSETNHKTSVNTTLSTRHVTSGK